MLNIAVILAGGSGQRAGGGIPKQFKKINDKTILEYSLEKFNSAPSMLIHDAVRPLVSQRIIEEVITELQTYKAVNVAIPATDTIIEVDPTHAYVSRIPDRNILYQVQTPQGFHNQTLQEAYALALKDPDFKTTDDCSVVKKYLPQEEIKIVKGEACNMKFTYKEDIIILEQLLKNEGKCYV